MSCEEFCIAEAIRHARSLSYCDCLSFLSGLVLLAGDSPEAQPLREAVAGLTDGDRQLELLADRQLKFQELLRQ